MTNEIIFEQTWFRSFWVTAGKRILDITVSISGIIISIPVWLIAGILIPLDSEGPVIYRQRRLGKDGKPFWLLKLRTMYKGAEANTGPVWSWEKDQRVTRMGRFLRRWHLDETLQFVNVLMGHMSVIGPRPEREEIVRKIEGEVPHYRERLQVKPGITGLAQIHQSYDSCIRDVQRKVRYDLLYVRKMCAYLDMKILYLTALWVVQNKGQQ